jgi:predicted GNAT family acetyltransferase
MLTENFAVVARTLQAHGLEYVASVGDDGSPVCFTGLGKRALRFKDEDASVLVNLKAAEGEAHQFSMMRVAICPVHSHFDERGFTVFLKIRLGDGPDMGGVIDGTRINPDFTSNTLDSLSVNPQGDRVYYINRLFVHSVIRGFGVADAMLTELCRKVDELTGQTALLVEPSPYDETVSRSSLKNLFEKHGFIEKTEGFMIRLHA